MKYTLILAAALSLAAAQPARARSYGRAATLPADTLIAEEETFDLDAADGTDVQPAGADTSEAGETGADGPADANDPAALCPYQDELLSEYDNKQAEYEVHDPADPDHGASFSAMVYHPTEVAKGGGFSRMLSRILSASVSDEAGLKKWKTDGIEKMLEARWRLAKQEYNHLRQELRDPDTHALPPISQSQRLTVTPVWQTADRGGHTTYCIEDELYSGGAHGIVYHYYLTLGQRTDSLLSLTDVFRAEALPQVFSLIESRLKAHPLACTDAESWPPVAEIEPAPEATDYSLRAAQYEQYGGKCYPRPALCPCGVIFTYPPYVKGPYAIGTVHILLTNDEVRDFLK